MCITKSSQFLFLVLMLIISIIKADAPVRKVYVTQNPNCEKDQCEKNGINIVYVKASSNSDVLHYVFAGGNFTEALSVILIRSTDFKSSLSINYTNLMNNASDSVVDFTGKIDGAFGLVFTKLIEYNDTSNTADMEKSSTFRMRGFNEFNWKVLNVANNSFCFSTISMKNGNNDMLLSNGKIEIRFNVSGEKTIGSGMPHLLFSGNNTQIDFMLNNLDTSYKNSRFAVEVALINRLNSGTMKIEEIRSLSDEHSPGVFRTVNFNGQSKTEDPRNRTYLQWKPVCYLSPYDRSLNNISVAKYYTPKPLYNSTREVLRTSLAGMFFRDIISLKDNTIGLLNVSFGMIDDKFYNHTRYAIWTSSFGQGTPLTDKISIVVIMVIAFGLGLPFVLIVVGSIYLVIRKRLNKRKQYETIEDPIN